MPVRQFEPCRPALSEIKVVNMVDVLAEQKCSKIERAFQRIRTPLSSCLVKKSYTVKTNSFVIVVAFDPFQIQRTLPGGGSLITFGPAA